MVHNNNTRIWMMVLTVIGILVAVISVILLGFLHKIIEVKIDNKIYIRNNSDAFDRFVQLPVPMYLNVYFFHIRNIEQFNGSLSSLNFMQKGPYVWDAIWTKENIQFMHYDELVSYDQQKNYTFNEKLSIDADTKQQLHADDYLQIFNPILGLHDKNFLKTLSQVTLVVNDTATNLAFDGSAKLFGNSLLGPPVQVDPNMTIYTGKKHIDTIGTFVIPRLNVWNDTGNCNDVKGTDGTMFHPDVEDDETLYVYVPSLCRTLLFQNDDTVHNREIKGASTTRFYSVERNFVSSPENQCYCYESNPKNCPADTLNLIKCGRVADTSVEIIASSPYFLFNQDLYDELPDYVAPKALTHENYATVLDVEPYTGIVFNAFERIQLNVQIQNGTHKVISNLNKEKLIVPMLYIERTGQVDDANAQKFDDEVLQPKRVATGFLIAAISLGTVLMIIAAACGKIKKFY